MTEISKRFSKSGLIADFSNSNACRPPSASISQHLAFATTAFGELSAPGLLGMGHRHPPGHVHLGATCLGNHLCQGVSAALSPTLLGPAQAPPPPGRSSASRWPGAPAPGSSSHRPLGHFPEQPEPWLLTWLPRVLLCAELGGGLGRGCKVAGAQGKDSITSRAVKPGLGFRGHQAGSCRGG